MSLNIISIILFVPHNKKKMKGKTKTIENVTVQKKKIVFQTMKNMKFDSFFSTHLNNRLNNKEL